MKKKIMAFVIGIVITLTAISTASAEEYQGIQEDDLREIAPKLENIFDELNKEIMFPGQALENEEMSSYTVKEGDTLSTIAHAHEIDVEELKLWNLLASQVIMLDQELMIPELKSSKSEPKVKSLQITNDEVEETVEVKEEEAKEEKEEAETQKQEAPASEAKSTEQQAKTLSMTATAYTAECTGCSGITATGINLNEDRNKKVIAVDPNVIPLGTRVHVEGYGEAIAGDTGGAIKGNKIDIHVPTKDEAFSWGVRTVKVTILN